MMSRLLIGERTHAPRDRDFEELHTHARGGALPRLRARGGKVDDSASTSADTNCLNLTDAKCRVMRFPSHRHPSTSAKRTRFERFHPVALKRVALPIYGRTSGVWISGREAMPCRSGEQSSTGVVYCWEHQRRGISSHASTTSPGFRLRRR